MSILNVCPLHLLKGTPVNVIDILVARGVCKVWPEGSTVPRGGSAKFGIDPTRDRLHLGHLVPLRVARALQDSESWVLDLVLGTLTASLGDPSGQDKTRPVLDFDLVLSNADSLEVQCRRRVLSNQRLEVVRNHTLTEDLSVSQFLTMAVSKFTVASLMSRQGFKNRGAGGVRAHELLVPLLQGWDSVALETDLEIGGNDQLFNFGVTRELQASQKQTPEVCLLTPIINGPDGRKMSKSFDNCIWFDDTPTDVYGKTMSISDDQVERWAALLTDLDLENIRLMLDTKPMEAKRCLAFDLVVQLHGPDAAQEADKAFSQRVQGKMAPPIEEMASVPPGGLLAALQVLRGCSKSQARRLVQGGGVKLNGVKVSDPNTEVQCGCGDIIKAGKRSWGHVSG
jgi:tyrosyl-tRNA synthetase